MEQLFDSQSESALQPLPPKRISSTDTAFLWIAFWLWHDKNSQQIKKTSDLIVTLPQWAQ